MPPKSIGLHSSALVTITGEFIFHYTGAIQVLCNCFPPRKLETASPSVMLITLDPCTVVMLIGADLYTPTAIALRNTRMAPYEAFMFFAATL